jgi:hypothetical protein
MCECVEGRFKLQLRSTRLYQRYHAAKLFESGSRLQMHNIKSSTLKLRTVIRVRDVNKCACTLPQCLAVQRSNTVLSHNVVYSSTRGYNTAASRESRTACAHMLTKVDTHNMA